MENTVNYSQCEPITDPVLTANFHWLYAQRLQKYCILQNCEIIMLSWRYLPTNFQGSSLIFKAYVQTFLLSQNCNILGPFLPYWSLLCCIHGNFVLISSWNKFNTQMYHPVGICLYDNHYQNQAYIYLICINLYKFILLENNNLLSVCLQ